MVERQERQEQLKQVELIGSVGIVEKDEETAVEVEGNLHVVVERFGSRWRTTDFIFLSDKKYTLNFLKAIRRVEGSEKLFDKREDVDADIRRRKTLASV